MTETRGVGSIHWTWSWTLVCPKRHAIKLPIDMLRHREIKLIIKNYILSKFSDTLQKILVIAVLVRYMDKEEEHVYSYSKVQYSVSHTCTKPRKQDSNMFFSKKSPLKSPFIIFQYMEVLKPKINTHFTQKPPSVFVFSDCWWIDLIKASSLLNCKYHCMSRTQLFSSPCLLLQCGHSPPLSQPYQGNSHQ